MNLLFYSKGKWSFVKKLLPNQIQQVCKSYFNINVQGLKYYVCADGNGYIHSFFLYRGEATPEMAFSYTQTTEEERETSRTCDIVKYCIQQLPESGHHVYLDMFYGSDKVSVFKFVFILQVLQLCKKEKHNVTMNVARNRGKCFKDYFSKKFPIKLDQTWDWLLTDDIYCATYLSWNDKKVHCGNLTDIYQCSCAILSAQFMVEMALK